MTVHDSCYLSNTSVSNISFLKTSNIFGRFLMCTKILYILIMVINVHCRLTLMRPLTASTRTWTPSRIPPNWTTSRAWPTSRRPSAKTEPAFNQILSDSKSICRDEIRQVFPTVLFWKWKGVLVNSSSELWHCLLAKI